MNDQNSTSPQQTRAVPTDKGTRAVSLSATVPGYELANTGDVPTLVPVVSLYRGCDRSALSFDTTANLKPLEGLIGQERAVGALSLATEMTAPGFNVFVTGPNSRGVRHAVRTLLAQASDGVRAPNDWVYVNNFSDSRYPKAIDLPTGRAVTFGNAMHNLIEDLKLSLPAAFEREEYQTRHGAIDDAARQKQTKLFEGLNEKCETMGIAFVRTQAGFGFAPASEGKIVEPDVFNSWPESKRARVQESIATLEKDLEHVMRQLPGIEKERREQIRALNRETASRAIGQSIDEVKNKFSDLEKIVAHLDRVRESLIDSVPAFLAKSGEGEQLEAEGPGLFERYEVNVLVSHVGRERGVPVVEEAHPTLMNLIGRSEYQARMGVLLTNFRLIKPGALHRANGGYLILDARNLLSEPFSWAALKRALRSGEIAIEDVSRFMGLAGTVSLEPDPIPLKIKVVLVGERLLYYLLSDLDPEFHEHFKLMADFEDDIDRTPENESLFARALCQTLNRNGLKPLDRSGVELIIEHASRMAGDACKLSVLSDEIRDILVEADHCRGLSGHDVLARAHVQHALDEREKRASRLREQSQQAIFRDIALIQTEGSEVGQINGLSVTELGGFRFGRPSRVTASARPGGGTVTDIEREVKLGGPLHSKGVLILQGFLAGRYALDTPMSLSASLVFEQSYGEVEGDSASVAELCALLSAIAERPLRQDLAVTGSVNQHGEVQAIGGVNEKIEGFFDICKTRGLTGTQGVIIPRSNVQHLMLRPDIVSACANGQFAIHAVTNVDQSLALLMGIAAGARGPNDQFAEGSVNRAVDDRLRAFAAIRRNFGDGHNQSAKPGPV